MPWVVSIIYHLGKMIDKGWKKYSLHISSVFLLHTLTKWSLWVPKIKAAILLNHWPGTILLKPFPLFISSQYLDESNHNHVTHEPARHSFTDSTLRLIRTTSWLLTTLREMHLNSDRCVNGQLREDARLNSKPASRLTAQLLPLTESDLQQLKLGSNFWNSWAWSTFMFWRVTATAP